MKKSAILIIIIIILQIHFSKQEDDTHSTLIKINSNENDLVVDFVRFRRRLNERSRRKCSKGACSNWKKRFKMCQKPCTH